ncbi:MAG: Cache 3/Cache 2 fusion domain-containing protein, partial [Azoarcus sp.]|nr:Cache 3/Cache 2 fusion domain-containing protein [Azoarcus sp.]
MFSIRRLPLTQQTLICVILLCLLVAISSSIALRLLANSIADKAALNALQTQTNLIALTLEYAEKNIQRESLSELKRFETLLPPARLTGRTVTVGGMALPEMVFGDHINAVSNQSYLLAYKEKNPTNDVAFMVKVGDKLYRATTLLKDAAGQYRDGTVMTGSYVEQVVSGQIYLGTTWRSGKLYALAMRPLKDESGRVIGAISMRVAVDEEIESLKKRMEGIVLGKTGYPIIIGMPFGDRKEAEFFLHPTLSGKPLSAAPDTARTFFQQVLGQKNGTLSYEWLAQKGDMEKKIAVFREIPTMHWIIVTSAPMAEYTETYTDLARYALIGLMGMVLLLVLCLWGIIHHQLHPIKRLVQVLAYMGEGDLTHALAVEPG